MIYDSAQWTVASPNIAGTNAWHRNRRGTHERRTSALFWLTVFCLGCVSLLCVAIGASSVLARKGAEKPLQSTNFLPKLMSSYGESKANAFTMSEPELSELAQPKDRKTAESFNSLPVIVEKSHGRVQELPAVPMKTREWAPVAVEPLLIPNPNVEITPSPLSNEVCNDPIIFLKPCTPHRGDSPMIQNWNTLTLYALLSAATFTYVPQPIIATAADTTGLNPGDQVDKQALKKSHEAILESISKLEKRILAELNSKLQLVGDDVKGLTSSVDALKVQISLIQAEQLKQKLQLETAKVHIDQLTVDVRELQKRPLANTNTLPSPTPPVDKTSLDEIRSRLTSIQDALAKFTPGDVRSSFSPPNVVPTSNTGRVMLVNLYSDEVLFTVNGTSYRVLPRSQRTLDNVPAGALHYEVMASRWGLLDRQTTNLANGETFTLTAR